MRKTAREAVRKKARETAARAEIGDRGEDNALEDALKKLERESQRDSAERRDLKRARNQSLASLQQSVAEAEEKVRFLKQQYKTRAKGWQQQLQAAYFAELASGAVEFDPLRVLYQDADLIVVDKPAGLLSVPGRQQHLQDSVLSRLRYQMQKEMPEQVPAQGPAQGPAQVPAQKKILDGAFLQAVHRLDRDTSGVMAIALSARAQANLSCQFARGQVHKRYEAILSCPIEKEGGTIALPLWSCPDYRPKQVVNRERGKPSKTNFKVLAKGAQPRIEFRPCTGRTHQLRVHAAHPDGLNSPILGDTLYGTDHRQKRLFLHAAELHFVHPVTQHLLKLESQVPF
ncbi:MAG: RluA family pseudouridine synthase [Phormidesmis sp.]